MTTGVACKGNHPDCLISLPLIDHGAIACLTPSDVKATALDFAPGSS
ncbi:hypothetical protein [Nostoc sp. C110]